MHLAWSQTEIVYNSFHPEYFPNDAKFFPSVETALSIVHDVNVRLGENVAVFGQGLIGLLVTSILCTTALSSFDGCHKFGTVTVFDTIPDRLAKVEKPSCLWMWRRRIHERTDNFMRPWVQCWRDRRFCLCRRLRWIYCLVSGVKVTPSNLLESGFEFEHDTIDKAVESAVP